MAETTRSTQGASLRTALLAGLLLAVITFAAFSPLLDADFISFDDPVYVTENARVQAGLTWANIRWAFTTTYFGFYYPLTWLSHMLDCQVFGMWAGGHHLTSLLIHIASTLLLFGLLRRATGDPWPSLLVAALFAVHPLHVESVAWIAERKDVLSTFFLMLALWAYVEYARKPGAVRYLAVLLLFVLGLMSKAMVVTAPILMLILDVWPLGRLKLGGDGRGIPGPGPAPGDMLRSIGHCILEKVPLFALSVAFAVITFYTQESMQAVASLAIIPVGLRVGNALVSYGTYIGRALLPANLSIFYPFERSSLTYYRPALGAALIFLVTVLCWRFRSRRPYWLTGWLWYLVALVPVIGILQVGSQASADRYTYVSLIGLFMGLAWWAAEIPLWTAGAKAAAGAAATCLILGCAGLSWYQARTWHDSVSVFSHAVWATRGNYLAHTLLGTALQEKRDLAGAEDNLKEAIRIAPRYVNAWGNLGNVFRDMGNLKEAVGCYERVMALDPRDAKAYANLGLARELQGRMEEAEVAIGQAVKFAPENSAFWVALGRIQTQMGKDEEARRAFREAARLNPSSNGASYYLGLLDSKEGRAAEAETNLRKAMALAKSLPQPRIKLGKLLADQGRDGEARELLQEALRLDPGNAEARGLLDRLPDSGATPMRGTSSPTQRPAASSSRGSGKGLQEGDAPVPRVGV